MAELPEFVKQEIKSAYQAIKASFPQFKDRFQQRKMIGLVSSTLGAATDHPIAAIEGPTGTGKTLAYLLGAIPVAHHLEKPLVISSATVALQEQLLQKDIPLIQKHTNYEFSVHLAKGRGRYVCLTRLAQLSGNTQTDLLDTQSLGVWSDPPGKQDVALVKQLFNDYKDGHWNGDKDHCNTFIPAALWGKINNHFHYCTGSKCSDYDRCIFYRERRKLGNADIIIANHDLVLADLRSEAASILPPIEESLYIFDEAHHLPDKAIGHFSASASLLGAVDWIKSIPKAFIKEVTSPSLKHTKEEISTIASLLSKGLQDLHQALQHQMPTTEGELVRFPFGVPSPEILQMGEQHIWPALQKLYQKMHIATEVAKKELESEDPDANSKEQQITALGFLFGRTENLYQLWQMMLHSDPQNHPPTARWLSVEKEDFVLHAAPINASAQLQQVLWQKTEGCILTSATLTALNSFQRIQDRIGLDETTAQFVRLPSPFDLSRVQLHIPAMDHTPKQPDLHTKEILALLPELLGHAQGNLVLFSARKQMEEIYQALPITIKKYVHQQGSSSREHILETHQHLISQGKPSTLFGLNTFAEGLDLPGTLCEQVIIAKLPFAVPTSPREQAYAEWVESLGKNAFFSIAVPDASMRLIQACGRLIRQEQDSGRIVVLDTRLASTAYGKTMLGALPPYTLANQP